MIATIVERKPAARVDDHQRQPRINGANFQTPYAAWISHSFWLNLFTALVALVVLAHAGCNSLIDSRVPELIQRRADPQGGRAYLLYRPSGYDNKRSWPLIVVCHTSFPDSANRQIRAWTKLAESKGFLVAAPTLTSVSMALSRRSSSLSLRLKQDETHILAVVQHIRAGYNISHDRILLAGYAKGALVALHVGLRHPEIFRALAVTQPAFDNAFLEPTTKWLDPYQPVRLHYDTGDALRGKSSAACADWLRQHGVNVREDLLGPSGEAANVVTVNFFGRILREEPWVRIVAERAPSTGSLARRFALRSTLSPESLRWSFGDGDESVVRNPIHVYKTPNRYRVTVTLRNKTQSLQRTLNVTVP